MIRSVDLAARRHQIVERRQRLTERLAQNGYWRALISMGPRHSLPALPREGRRPKLGDWSNRSHRPWEQTETLRGSRRTQTNSMGPAPLNRFFHSSKFVQNIIGGRRQLKWTFCDARSTRQP